MDKPLPSEVTRVLQRLDAGERDAFQELLPLVYEELHAVARVHMAAERPDHTLQPTALVHEVYLKLSGKEHPCWRDRAHFIRAAAVVMRSILVNYARDRRRKKRGGDARRLPLDETLVAFEERAVDLIALDGALEQLAEINERQCTLVELRFFAGVNLRECAEILNISERTANADWRSARQWLWEQLGSE